MDVIGSPLKHALSLQEIYRRLPHLSRPSLMELLSLSAELRPLIRIGVSASESLAYQEILEQLGFYSKVWCFELGHEVNLSIDTFQVSSKVVEKGKGDRSIIFVSNDPEKFQNIDAIALEDDFLGYALGYPPCCIDAFNRNRNRLLEDYTDIFQKFSGPFPYWSNVLVEVFGWSLISHFPCRPDCRATHNIAKSVMDLLKETMPAYAIKLMSELRSKVIYSKELGMLSIKHSDWATEILPVKPAAMTSGWSESLVGAEAITVSPGRSKRHVIVNSSNTKLAIQATLFDFCADSDLS